MGGEKANDFPKRPRFPLNGNWYQSLLQAQSTLVSQQLYLMAAGFMHFLALVTHGYSPAGFRGSDAGITKRLHPAAASGASQQHRSHLASHHRTIHGGQSSAAAYADAGTTSTGQTVVIFRALSLSR